MINALNTASQGLLQAERRATEVAREIVKSTSESASFSAEDAAPLAQDTGAETTGARVSAPSGPGYADLLQQMVDLKAEERSFVANATVFKRLDETFDEGLGTLFEDEG